MSNRMIYTYAASALILLIIGGAAASVRVFESPVETEGQDIYYSYVEGHGLLKHENPLGHFTLPAGRVRMGRQSGPNDAGTDNRPGGLLATRRYHKPLR
jgi:hypothetical protein